MNDCDDLPRVTLLGEMFPGDPIGISRLLEPMDLTAGVSVPTREWRELYTALDCAAVAAIHPFYTASIRELKTAGRPVVGSAPVGLDGTASWLSAIGDVCDVAPSKIAAAKNAALPAVATALSDAPIKGRITLSGYEGSELLVARLLCESGADVRYVGSACPATPFASDDKDWLEQRGVHVQFRASLEQDLQAMRNYDPDLVIGTTPVVQAAKQNGTPALYFTNLISARPLMGPAGAGSLAEVINAAIASKDRFDAMKAFFGGVGEKETAGIWRETPKEHKDFKKKQARKRAIKAKRDADLEAPVGC